MYGQTELSSEFLLKHQYHKMSVESLQCSRWQLCLVSGTECDMMTSLQTLASAVQENGLMAALCRDTEKLTNCEFEMLSVIKHMTDKKMSPQLWGLHKISIKDKMPDAIVVE